MISKVLNQKGQSLVEVTVALSIFAVVFITVVNLAINAVNLMLDSRDKVEAVAYAQRYLEERKGSKSNECGGLTNTTIPPTPFVINEKYGGEVKVEDNGTFPGAVLVTSKVTWEAKNGVDRDITVKQIMSRN